MKLEAAFRLLRRNAGQSMSLNRDGDVFHIPLSYLFYIEVYGHRLIYHSMEGDITMSTSQTLSMLEEELGKHGFVRCHKGYLINLRYVDALEGNSLRLDGKELTVSRSRRKTVLQALLEYTKGEKRDA